MSDAKRESWLQQRQNGIGASEASAVVGLNGYQSAYGLWYQKTEPVKNEPMDELAEWGLLLEPVILEQFSIRSGVPVTRIEPYSITRARDRDHVTCTLDGLTNSGEPVQLKTAHFGAGRIWNKEVPMSYLCQCQMEIHCTEADHAYIAVLIDGYQFRWHKINRHQKFIDKLLKRIDHFWFEHVIKRVPPPTDYHEATTRALTAKYPTASGKVVELPEDCEPLFDELKKLTATETAASKRKDEIKNYVRQFIGDNRYGYLPNGKGFQWSGENGKRRFTTTERCPEPSQATGNH